MQAEIDELQDEVKELRTQVSCKSQDKDKIARMMGEIKQLKEERERIDRLNSELQTKCTELQIKVLDATAKVEADNRVAVVQQSRIAELQERCIALETTIKTMNAGASKMNVAEYNSLVNTVGNVFSQTLQALPGASAEPKMRDWNEEKVAQFLTEYGVDAKLFKEQGVRTGRVLQALTVPVLTAVPFNLNAFQAQLLFQGLTDARV